MKFGLIKMAAAAFAIVVSGQAQAASITTTFASNNGGRNGGVVYFDLNVLNSGGITIERLLTNASETFTGGSLSVYTRAGTASGFQSSTAGWTLASSGVGDSAGENNPTAFDVADFSLAFGLTGIALVSDANAWAHRYTTGNGANQSYSNADLSLAFGSASNAPFSTGLYQPRVWNGTIEYSVAPVPLPASFVLLGAGLGGLGLIGTRRRRRETNVS